MKIPVTVHETITAKTTITEIRQTAEKYGGAIVGRGYLVYTI